MESAMALDPKQLQSTGTQMFEHGHFSVLSRLKSFGNS